MTKWGTRILAFLFIVLSVVSLAIPRDSGIMLGVTLMCAAIPPFATSAIALKVEPDAPLRLGEGRFFICVFSVAMMGCGAWVVGWDHNCSTTNARCNAGGFEPFPFGTHFCWSPLSLLRRKLSVSRPVRAKSTLSPHFIMRLPQR